MSSSLRIAFRISSIESAEPPIFVGWQTEFLEHRKIFEWRSTSCAFELRRFRKKTIPVGVARPLLDQDALANRQQHCGIRKERKTRGFAFPVSISRSRPCRDKLRRELRKCLAHRHAVGAALSDCFDVLSDVVADKTVATSRGILSAGLFVHHDTATPSDFGLNDDGDFFVRQQARDPFVKILHSSSE
jgi:hypothetical protein